MEDDQNVRTRSDVRLVQVQDIRGSQEFCDHALAIARRVKLEFEVQDTLVRLIGQIDNPADLEKIVQFAESLPRKSPPRR